MWDNFWGRSYTVLVEHRSMLWEALQVTLQIAFLGFIFALVLGSIVAIIRVSTSSNIAMRVARWLAAGYVLILRGLPMVVQLLLLFFIVFPAMGLSLNPVTIAIIAFSLNGGAYISESLRGAINSIDKGQMEAGRALGMSSIITMWKVVLPQAYKNAVPQLGNELILLLKETPIVGFITVVDLTRAMVLIQTRTFDLIVPYMLLAVIFLIMVYVLTLVIKFFEKVVFKNAG